MTISTKTTIKNYFQTADKPTQAQFCDFIDSCIFGAETSAQSIGSLNVTGVVSALTVNASNGIFSVVTPTNITGTTTNNDASVGSVGEYASSTIGSGAIVGLSTGAAANITSISLSAGDWDVWVNSIFGGNAATTVNYMGVSISTTSATMDNTPGRTSFVIANNGTAFTYSSIISVNAGRARLSLAAPTTVYFVAIASFGTNTMGAYGIIQARRVR